MYALFLKLFGTLQSCTSHKPQLAKLDIHVNQCCKLFTTYYFVLILVRTEYLGIL